MAALGRDVGTHAGIMQGELCIFPNQLETRALEGARDVVPLGINCDVSLQAVPHDIGLWLRLGWKGEGWHEDMALSRPAQKDSRVDLQDGHELRRVARPWTPVARQA